jgi:hypothetical protein
MRGVLEKSENRAARREAAKKTVKEQAIKWARVAETKVIERALQTFRLMDGSLLSKRHWYELGYIARNSEREARIVRAISKLAKPADDKVLVGNVISPEQFDKILKDVGPQ